MPEPVRFEMSDLKELAIEAASKGSAPTAVLAVLLLAGFLVQNPGPEDHRVILETRLVCPSSAELSSPEHVRRRPSQDELEPRTATGLSDYAVFSLSSLLPLMPATGLAKQGYDASLGGPGGNPILSALANGPAFRLSAVHAIGQAGTFLVSQIARFSSTRPGADFYERCGPASVERICKRASDNNLSTVQLVRPLPPPTPTTTTTTTTTTTETTTAAANFSDIFSCPRNKRSGGEMLNETSQIDLNEGELKFFQNFTLDRVFLRQQQRRKGSSNSLQQQDEPLGLCRPLRKPSRTPGIWPGLFCRRSSGYRVRSLPDCGGKEEGRRVRQSRRVERKRRLLDALAVCFVRRSGDRSFCGAG